MASYILRGSKQRGSKIGRVQVDADRSLVLNGEPVELSDTEYEQYQHRYVLEAVDGAVPDEPEPDTKPGDEPSAESGSDDDDNSHT